MQGVKETEHRSKIRTTVLLLYLLRKLDIKTTIVAWGGADRFVSRMRIKELNER